MKKHDNLDEDGYMTIPALEYGADLQEMYEDGFWEGIMTAVKWVFAIALFITLIILYG